MNIILIQFFYFMQPKIWKKYKAKVSPKDNKGK